MEDEQANLSGQLDTVNQSVFFLILIILSVLLSFWGVLIQREELVRALRGGTGGPELPPVYPIRHSASALVTGSLGFFFVLALQTCRGAARSGDAAARQSAGRNVWASLFVLAAAIIRFYDLEAAEAARHTSDGAEEPAA